MTRREKLLAAAAVVVAPFAIVLAIFATDVLRTPSWITEDDSRFTAAPLRSGITVALSVSPAFTVDGRQPKL